MGFTTWLGAATLALTVCAILLARPAHGQAEQGTQTDHAKLWQAYTSRFISSDGRVIDHSRAEMTTSEGQSYGLFFSLVNNDRARFDKIFTWTEANLAGGDLATHLPSWSWGQNKAGKWGPLDPNSASDSDLWIAYDLIEAGRLWNDPHYASVGGKLAALIAHREVADLPGFGPALLPGPVGFKLPKSWILNPSYSPVFILDRLAKAQPAGPWADVAAMVPVLLERSAKSGFAMDWVSYTPGQGFTPCLVNGHTGPAANGSYDAIRVYLWAGMLDDESPAKAPILKALSGMNLYLQQHPAPPEKISNQGVPQNNDGPSGFSAALLPYLKSIPNDSAVAQQMVRLKSQLDEKSNLYGNPPAYYDQNLALFASGWMEQRFRFGSSGELLVPWSRK
jgi:endoglucanase